MIEFNKYLLSSLKSNNLTISIDDEEYLKIISNIEKLREYYLKFVQQLYDNKRTINIMHEHTKIVQMIVEYVMNLFPVMNKYRACSFLTGSFARCSCKLNSDLDFHIIYFDKYDNESLKYEEIIYYMLSEIFALGRNKIHPMLITKMHPDILKYLENNLDDNDLNISFKSNNYEINYKIRSNLKRRIYLQYCRNNTISNVVSYLKSEIDNKNSEWAHVIYPVTMKDELYKEYKKLYEYEKQNITCDKILSRIEYIKGKISKISSLLNEINTLNISDFKDIYQKQEFSLINEYISLKRDIFLFNNMDWPIINYYDNLINFKDDLIFNNALEYMFLLFDMTEHLGNRYSLHTNELIEIPNLNMITAKINSLNELINDTIQREEMVLGGKNDYYHANCTL